MIALAALVLMTFQQPQFKVAGIFTDHMVLQRERKVPVWGWAAAGQKVAVEGSWGQKADAVADGQGRWEALLKTTQAGGPYILTVTSESGAKSYQDVMLGEVWLCSGQSNMEWPVGDVGYNPPIEGAKEETAAANYPNIRLLQVPRVGSATPLADVSVQWQRCSPETVKNFSATGYLFGKNLFQSLNIPIGLISSNVGGTEIELWMSEPALRTVPSLGKSITAKARSQQDYQKVLSAWEEDYSMDDQAVVQEASSASDWTKIAGAESFEGSLGLSTYDGIVWYRAEFMVDEATEGTITLGAIDDADTTYLNGAMIGRGNVWNANRTYDALLKKGKNVIAIKVLDTGGGGGFEKNAKPNVRIGTVEWPFTNWAFKVGPALSILPPRPAAPGAYSTLFNGMMHPIVPFALRGAIWYQGESNVGRGYQYRETFPAMIRSWRAAFRDASMPFYWVQIAPWTGYGPVDSGADLRESQSLTLGLKFTGQAITTDITPNFADIHPAKKREVGQRLANIALSKTYGKKEVAFSGPVFTGMKIDGNRARLSFTFAQGLAGTQGFAVAGEDQKFLPAQVKIESNTIVVWADGVSKPVAVRYAWANAPICDLRNSAGLPASPFRTDNWPLPTRDVSW